MAYRRHRENMKIFKIRNDDTDSEEEKEVGIITPKKRKKEIRDLMQFNENSEEYFATNSLFLFSNENKFRIFLQKIVSSKQFILIINIIILINVIFLILETIEYFQIITLYSEYVLAIIFIIEFIIKVISYGFFIGQHSYLRDPWNWLDFIVVISSIINLFPQINTNLFALRTFRLLRPLKTMSFLPHMRTFISVLINSLIDVGTVFLLLLFFIIIFAIFGLSFWNEKFEYRCRVNQYPINGILEINQKYFYNLCGGEMQCDNCLSVMKFKRNKNYFISDAYDFKNELNYEEFNYGLTTFNNIFWSLLTVFQVLTCEGWNNIMYLLIDSYNYYGPIIYFVLNIVINYYFMINLIVAVLIYNYRKVRRNDISNYFDEGSKEKKIKMFNYMININLDNYNVRKVKKNYQLKYSPIELSEDFIKKYHNLNEHEVDKKKNNEITNNYKMKCTKLCRKIHCFSKVKEHNQYHKKHKFAFFCYQIYKQPIFQIFIYLCIIGNGVILALDRINIPQNEENLYEILNIILVFIFTFEICITIIAYGKEFFLDLMNVFDGFIVFISLIEVIFYKFDIFVEYKNNSTSIAFIFQLLRIFRIFKLLRSWESFQIIIGSIFDTMIRIIDFLILFIIFIFIYTLLGFQFFRNSLKFNGKHYQPQSESNFYHFDDFLNSLMCVFMIIIGDHWYELFYDCYRSDKNNKIAVIVYFVTLILFGHLTLLNIFLAYLIENFQASLFHREKNRNVHYFILEIIYKSSEISSNQIINYQAMNKSKKGQKTIEKIKKNNSINNNGSVYNYYLMKLYSKNLEFEGDLEIIAKNKIDFISFKEYNSEYYKKINKYTLDKNKSLSIKKTFTLNKFIDNDPKKEEKARNDAIKYIDTNDSYYSFGIDYKMENDAKTNLKVFNMINNFEHLYHKKNSLTDINIIEKKSKREESELIENYSETEKMNIIYEKSFISGKDNSESNLNQINTNLIPLNMKKSLNQKNAKIIYKDMGLLEKTENDLNLTFNKTFNRPKIKNFDLNNNEENTPERKFTYELPKATNLISNRTKILMETEGLENDLTSESNGENIIMDYSLFIFSPENKFRNLCTSIIKNWLYNYILICLIIGNLTIICLDNPWLNPSSKRKKIIDILNLFFESIFIIEGIIKTISKGFLLNKSAYLRYLINLVDFICIIIAIIDFIWSKNINYLRSLLGIRLIPLFRIIFQSENLFLMSKTLISSIYSMINLLICGLIFIIIFALIGIKMFKENTYYYCLENPKFSQEECYKNNATWIYNEENFSNFFEALKVIFEIMVSENWNKIMMIGSLTKKNKNYEFFFVFVVLILHMLFLNLIIAIMIQKFDKIKQQRNYIKELTEPEREWVHIQKIFMKFHPMPKLNIPKENTFRKKLEKIVNSKAFDNIISILIILSCCTLLIQHNGTSKTYDNILTYVNILFSLLFTIELIIKLLVYKKLYFMNNWNIFDFIIIILSDILAILNILSLINLINIQSLSTVPILLRLFRIFRVLRIFNNFGKLRALIDSLNYLIPSLCGIFLIILVLLLIYGNIGMHFFSDIPYRKHITRNNNFRNFFSSISLLFQCITGEDWVYFMSELAYHDCRNPNSVQYKEDYYCYHYNITCYNKETINYNTMTKNNYFSCGTNFSYFYFISFIIIGPIYIMNLFIVMVIEGFNESIYENEGYLPQDLIDKFINLWMDYDPLCTKIIKPYEFILIMKELPPPIGFNYDRHLIEGINNNNRDEKRQKDYNQFLKCRNLIINNRNNLRLNKPNYSLPHSYDYNNIYVSNNGKFYTSDIEVMKLISKFKISVSEEKLKHYFDKDSKKINEGFIRNSFIFAAQKLKKVITMESMINKTNEKEKYLVIHFLDACLTISQFAISKSMNVNFDTLRRNIVSSYTKQLWKREYKNEDIEAFFDKKINNDEDNNKLSILLACQVLFKFKKIIKERIQKARAQVKKKNSSKSIFRKFSEMRKFKKENFEIKRFKTECNDSNILDNFTNNMNQLYINMTHINHNNDIYDTNIYDKGIKNNFININNSLIFYNANELNEIKNSKRNNSFSHSGVI